MDKYNIKLLKGGPEYAETDKFFFAIPFVLLSVAKRMSGKSCSLTQYLQILKNMGKLDRLIMVSPTWANNKHYFVGLPIDEENDVLEPTLHSADIVMRKLDEEAAEYDLYKEKLNKWKELQAFIKSKKNLNAIDEELLIYFAEDMKKPVPKYGGRKPIVVCMFDDCQNTPAFSPKSNISYLTIKHRHLGITKTDGSIGCNLMYAIQNYTSNSGGLPKSVRGNITQLCVFKNKNQKELGIIADECSGEVSPETFLKLHQEATREPYGFLTVDFNPKKNHPSMFRKCWDTWLIPDKNNM